MQRHCCVIVVVFWWFDLIYDDRHIVVVAGVNYQRLSFNFFVFRIRRVPKTIWARYIFQPVVAPLFSSSFFIADFVSIVLSCRTSSQKNKAGPSTPSTAAHRPLTHTHTGFLSISFVDERYLSIFHTF